MQRLKVTPIGNQIAVTVKLQTSILQNDETEQFKFNETGQLVQMKDVYYLRYQEGAQKIPVTFKFDQSGTVLLTRNASNRTRFCFQANHTFATHYQSEYGLIKMDVKTIRLLQETDFTAGHGKVAIDYELWAQAQLIGKYQIRLQFSK